MWCGISEDKAIWDRSVLPCTLRFLRTEWGRRLHRLPVRNSEAACFGCMPPHRTDLHIPETCLLKTAPTHYQPAKHCRSLPTSSERMRPNLAATCKRKRNVVVAKAALRLSHGACKEISGQTNAAFTYNTSHMSALRSDCVTACISEPSLRKQQHRHVVSLQPKLAKQAAALTAESC